MHLKSLILGGNSSSVSVWLLLLICFEHPASLTLYRKDPTLPGLGKYLCKSVSEPRIPYSQMDLMDVEGAVIPPILCVSSDFVW